MSYVYHPLSTLYVLQLLSLIYALHSRLYMYLYGLRSTLYAHLLERLLEFFSFLFSIF